jgi:hypothetical protein
MTKLLLKNKPATLFFLLLFAALSPFQMMAQKNVLYVTRSGFVPADGASSLTNDPIVKMLNADANFTVTVLATDVTGTDPAVSLAGYDLVIAQETFGSANDIWKPTGPLGIKNLSIPVIYNKVFALTNGRAVTETNTAVIQTTKLSVTVDPAKQTNPIYSGITFSTNDITLYSSTAANDGSVGNASIDVLNNLDISTTGTLLASTTDVVNADQAVVINDIPAGTQLGTASTDVLPSRMIAFGFNYGAIIMGDGTNISSEALTIWRNAAYILTGLTVPTTLYLNPALGVNENTLTSDSVSVSPNPTSGLVTVNSASAVKAITVYDSAGKQVSASKTNTVDLSNQAKGIYLVQVQTENGSTTKKIVVE